MTFKHILGRLTAYISEDGFLDEDTDAKWKPCPGEDFDLIFYKEGDPDKIQSLLHEEFHAVLERMGYHQAKLPEELEEMIVQTLSVFVTENYKIRPK